MNEHIKSIFKIDITTITQIHSKNIYLYYEKSSAVNPVAAKSVGEAVLGVDDVRGCVVVWDEVVVGAVEVGAVVDGEDDELEATHVPLLSLYPEEQVEHLYVVVDVFPNVHDEQWDT